VDPAKFHQRAPGGRRLLHLVVVLTVLSPALSWVVPQPKANVWRTLARAMGQDHICLSQGSTKDPIVSCLVGIPSQESELPPELLQWKDNFNEKPFPEYSREYSVDRSLPYPITNPFTLWKNWIQSNVLPGSPDEPQELELLGSSPATFCIQFVYVPIPSAERFYHFLPENKAYYTTPWCRQTAHVKMASTLSHKPLTLPKGLFLICGDKAFSGIPSRLLGGPCTLGRLSLLTPNKTMIMDWIIKNTSIHTIQKRDLTDLDPDCESDVIHWSKAKATAITIFLPWVSVAKSLGELGRLECWVAKQANVTSSALADLLADEEITRKATLQNRAAIDYLLLLHHHTCEEFEGLCCFNLSSRAENVRTSIKKIQDMVHNIKQETKDWFDQLFGNWGLSGWVNSAVKTALLVLLLLFLIGIAFGIIRRYTTKAITAATSSLSVNNVWTSAPPAEEIEMQKIPHWEDEDSLDPEDFIPEDEDDRWPAQREWFDEIYPPVRWY
ncbi:hypothetical protein HGM15179_010670, partial [Zosterops borbonicus]